MFWCPNVCNGFEIDGGLRGFVLLPNISKSDSKYQRRKKKKYFCRYFFTSQYLISRTKKGRKMRWSEIIRSNKKPSCRCPLKFFFKWAIVGLFFIYFQCFSNNQHIFYNKFMWKMSIQYTVPGFELTTFWLWVTSFYHLTRAPTNFLRFFTLPITG